MDAPLDIHFITTLIKEDAGLAAVREKVLENDDPSHGYDHVLRVALWTVRLKPDSCDIREAIAAALLHDAVTLPKNHQQRELASILSAERAEPILLDANFSSEAIERIKAAVRQYTCIENTSPTKNLAQALHDADRLDALGGIGILRCIATAERIGAKIFHKSDPFAQKRELDDKNFAIDFILAKLLPISDKMLTKAGKIEAIRRTKIIYKLLQEVAVELNISTPTFLK